MFFQLDFHSLQTWGTLNHIDRVGRNVLYLPVTAGSNLDAPVSFPFALVETVYYSLVWIYKDFRLVFGWRQDDLKHSSHPSAYSGYSVANNVGKNISIFIQVLLDLLKILIRTFKVFVLSLYFWTTTKLPKNVSNQNSYMIMSLAPLWDKLNLKYFTFYEIT